MARAVRWAGAMQWLRRWREPILAIIILSGVVRAFFFFRANAHLPQPFFYEPFDTWMDWFNTSYWAHHQGAYDAWATVYPPLSFVVLRLFSKDSCYAEANGYAARECDWVGLYAMHGFFLLNVVLLYFSFRKVDRQTAIWRALGLGFGLPSLFGLERGNLIVLCFTCVILGFGPLLKSARWRWTAVGMAINFKVYIVAALFPQLLRRRWRWFEGAIIATIVVYIVTYGLKGEGTPIEIYENIRDFSGLYQAITFLDLWYAATYIPLISLLDGQYAMVSALVGSQMVDVLLIVVPGLVRATQAMIVVAAVAAWIRPEVVPMHRLTFLGIAIAMISAEPGGYTQNILIFFVFLERAKGFGRTWSILTCYVLCMPFDIILDQVPPLVQESYLAGHTTFFTYYITVGPFLRPLLILSLAFALSSVTLRDVWSDIRHQGWKGRWRFRHDAPVMVGDGTVLAPGGSEAR
ncbi:hypothetical protein ASE89_19405 [Sphingomonas sp. Leaf30]|nr:hypothetical protein ASE89_19405 [Sphingomonas sp. Leaf30]